MEGLFRTSALSRPEFLLIKPFEIDRGDTGIGKKD